MMRMLMRFDPFREADRLAEATWGAPRARTAFLAMDAYRRGDEVVAEFDLPGVDPSTTEVTVEKNVLSVKAERRHTREESDEIVVTERPQGAFSRQLFLGDGLDSDRVTARFEDGVLRVTVPVKERAKARKVEVTTGQTEAIDASSSSAA
jgi:HSP20 family protein